MKTDKLDFVEVEVLDDMAIERREFDAYPEPIRGYAKALFDAVSTANAHMARYAEDTPEDIAAMSRKEARDSAQAANRDLKAIGEARKNLKAEWSAPITKLEGKLKTAIKPLEDIQAAYKARQMQAEDEEKAAKAQELREYYEDLAPFLALPLEGQNKALVPYERIADPKWGNRTASIKTCKEEIDAAVERIASNQKMLEGMGLKHCGEAMTEYWRTLDLEAAISKERELTEYEDMRRGLESKQEAAAREYEREAMGQKGLQAYNWVMRFTATEEQQASLVTFAKQLDITGTVKKEKSNG